MIRKLHLAIAVMIGCATALPLCAQVVREDGAKSIAGVLHTVAAPQVAMAEWTFKSAGGEVMFASLDADIYRIQSEHGDTVAVAAEEEPGGCSGEEGGPGLFKLKVLDASGAVLCSASRPAPPPGWQRDPRLACALPVTKGQATYRLRVELVNPEGELTQPFYPFLLNVSLRRIAPSGVNIQEAFAWSGSGGF
jgi:hypothetical protein